MDLTALTDALTQVISDETTLQAAITAVQGVVVTPPTEDPAWVAVQGSLVANGWSAPGTVPVEETEAPVATPSVDTTVDPTTTA